MTGSGVGPALSLCVAWRIDISVIISGYRGGLKLTIVLASISTKVLRVPTKVGLTAAGTIGARRSRIASPDRQVSRCQRDGGQSRIQRLFIEMSIRSMLCWDNSSTQGSQSGNGYSDDIKTHNGERLKRNMQRIKNQSKAWSPAHKR